MQNIESFFSTTVGKTFKTALYLAASAAIGYVVAVLAKDPTLFGVVTPIANVCLVAAKNYFDSSVKNY